MTVDLWKVMVHNYLDIVDEAGSFLGNIVAVVAVVDMEAYFVEQNRGFAPNPVPFCSHAYEKEEEVVFDSYLALTYCSQIGLGVVVVVAVETLVIVVVDYYQKILEAAQVAEIAVEHLQ